MTAESVDQAIRGFLQNRNESSEAALAATGRDGLDRMIDLWFGRSSERLSTVDGPTGKEAVDAQAAALSVVARSNPAAFVDAVESEDISIAILAILGDVDDPRVTDILCAHLADDDWLLRYNAVSSLSRRHEEASRLCIERALADSHLVVRDKAIEAIIRWDPKRAIGLYEELLRADGLTPLLRGKAESALAKLR